MPRGKPRSLQERIDDLDRQRAALQLKERALRARLNKQNRAARLRRQVKIGAIVEAATGAPIEGEQTLARLQEFLDKAKVDGRSLARAISAKGKPRPKSTKR